MITAEKIKEWKDGVTQAENKMSEIKGQINSVRESMEAEFGTDDIVEAGEQLDEMKEEKEKLTNKMDNLEEEIKSIMDDQF